MGRGWNCNRLALQKCRRQRGEPANHESAAVVAAEAVLLILLILLALLILLTFTDNEAHFVTCVFVTVVFSFGCLALLSTLFLPLILA